MRWVREEKVGGPSRVAILARTSRVLNSVCEGLTCNYRLISDTPLDDIGAVCSDLLSELLSYKHGATQSAQSLLESVSVRHFLSGKEQKALLQLIKSIRQTSDEEFIETALLIAAEIGLAIKPETIEATKAIQTSQSLLKMFHSENEGEVQVMTLHKSKGLEFDVVIHFFWTRRVGLPL